MEGDKAIPQIILELWKFQSTPSAWRETERTMEEVAVTSDFNPLPPHGGRHCVPPDCLAGCYFNPLPPHGGRHPARTETARIAPFQSTPSAWRETPHFVVVRCLVCHFNPLPPHGGRRNFSWVNWDRLSFQSTPSAWRETGENRKRVDFETFQSTPSAWRETKGVEVQPSTP